MKILIISALFPPYILGGAEVVAYHWGRWLTKNGHEVFVITTAQNKEESLWDVQREGMRFWKIWMPRPYYFLQNTQVRIHQKAWWHLQDHFDPFNAQVISKILDECSPDLVNIHSLQGIGYNIVSEIARRELPAVFTVHDLSLACIKTSMFKNGQNCRNQDCLCYLSTKIKWHHLLRLKKLSFWAPSDAILRQLKKFTPIHNRRHRVIKYPLSFSPAEEKRTHAPPLKLLYIGRLHATKGISFLLQCLQNLRKRFAFSMTVVGSGALEQELSEQFGKTDWCQFTGFISNEKIGDQIAQADLLCVPSLWIENSPLVVYQALGLSTPVIASRIGGLPELIEHGKTGFLLSPGDDAEWSAALEKIFEHPDELNILRQNSESYRKTFDQDALGMQVMNLFKETMEAN